MAEYAIIVVPRDRGFVPAPPGIAAAVALMEAFFPARSSDVRHKTSPTPRLVTAADAFDAFTCPACRFDVERFELEEDEAGETWWEAFEQRLQEAVDPTAEALEMPCCGAQVRAGEIELGGDAAFARFELSLREPGDELALSDERKAALAAALGCEILALRAVYS